MISLAPKSPKLNGLINNGLIFCIFLLLLPAINLPFIEKTTWGITKGLIAILFVLKLIFSSIKINRNDFWILLYLITINFSIIGNQQNFLTFKNYSTFLLLSVLYFSKPQISIKITQRVIKIASLILIILPGVFLLNRNFFMSFFTPANQRILKFNLERRRLYPLSFPELFLPFLFSSNQYLIISCLFLLTLLSAYRWRLLTFILAIIFAFLSNPKKLITGKLFLLTIIFGAIISIYFKTTIWSRLTLQTKESRKSTLSRITMAQESFSLFEKSPIIGVGFGNWTKRISLPFDYSGLPLFYQSFPQYKEAVWEINENRKNAHNWFFAMLSETGLLGFISTILLTSQIFILGTKKIRDPAGQSLLLFLFATLFENTHLAIPALTVLYLNLLLLN